MKKILLFCFLLSLFHIRAQYIQDNKVNLFTLKIDFMTLEFEGGNLAYYDCPACTNDSLPFDVEYHPPMGNEGHIVFILNEEQLGFFAGLFMPLSGGWITYPQNFIVSDPFVQEESSSDFPADMRVYDKNVYRFTDSYYAAYIQTVWTSIRDLAIVNEVLENNFKTGMYLYIPGTQVEDLYSQKWIVFFYKNTVINCFEELESEFQMYPNPTSDELNFNMQNLENTSYTIKAMDGKIVREASLDADKISVSELPGGMYFIEIKENNSVVKTLKFQKIE